MNQNANLNATVGVFFDSFAKITISIAVLIGSIHLSPQIVHKQIVPGVCLSLFILNYAYYFQAKQLSKVTGKMVTAMPSGLQSSCVFVWLFAIMLPIATNTHNPILAYEVGLLANLLNAIFFIISGILLIRLKKFIPNPALFSGLAGAAFTWLAINNLSTLFDHPLSGLLPFFIILAINIANIKIKVPTIMVGVIIGTIIALITHEFSWSFNTSSHLVGLSMPHWVMLNLSKPVIDTTLNYLPLILAFAIIDAISAVQILEESKLSDDTFNPKQSILISGIISGASSFIGNPFAMALFFGHYSWKQQGADHRYSLYNGVIYLILGLSGVAVLLINLIPDWVTLPILIIIGITTTAVSFNALESREYTLLIIGIIPILSELIYNKLELLALQNHIPDFIHTPGVQGLFTLAKGSILFSLLFTTMLYYIMKHKWLTATVCCLLLSFFTSIGFIHSQTPGDHFFSQINYVYLASTLCCLVAYILNRKNYLG